MNLKKKIMSFVDKENDGDICVLVKNEILKILIFIMDLRHDQCITNMIEFVQKNVIEWESSNKFS